MGTFGLMHAVAQGTQGWANFEKRLREITDHRDVRGDRAAHVE
jgi:hypothetical protein